MKAARFYNAHDIRVEDVNPPAPKEGEVLIDIEWCGICGSDLHEYIQGPMVVPRPGQPHSLTGDTLPVTMGHEFCGKVSKVPAGCDLKIGQQVMVDPRLYCRNCYHCKESNTHTCSSWGFLGLSGGGGGGLSQTVAVDPRLCYALPDSVDLSEAALIEPLTVGRHALKVSGFQDFSNMNALIVGGGPVGLAVIMNLKVRGIKKIYVSEPTEKRQNQAAAFADLVFDPRKVKVGDECRKLTDGRGVDIVFDCAGIPRGLVDAMDSLRHGGTLVNVAGWEKECVVPMMHFMLKEIIYRASMAYNDEDFREVVEDYIAGKFKGASKMITSRIHLDDVVSKGFEELIKNKDDHVKILVTPHKELVQ